MIGRGRCFGKQGHVCESIWQNKLSVAVETCHKGCTHIKENGIANERTSHA